MIDLIFNFANEIVLVKIEGNNIRFGTSVYGAQLANIEGIRLDWAGTIREFPDLKDNLDWRKIAINRFKDYIKTLKTEDEVSEYIIKELSSKGYTPKLKQVKGFRPQKIKCHG